MVTVFIGYVVSYSSQVELQLSALILSPQIRDVRLNGGSGRASVLSPPCVGVF